MPACPRQALHLGPRFAPTFLPRGLPAMHGSLTGLVALEGVSCIGQVHQGLGLLSCLAHPLHPLLRAAGGLTTGPVPLPFWVNVCLSVCHTGHPLSASYHLFSLSPSTCVSMRCCHLKPWCAASYITATLGHFLPRTYPDVAQRVWRNLLCCVTEATCWPEGPAHQFGNPRIPRLPGSLLVP